MDENVDKFDPFNRNRFEQYSYYDKSNGNPFLGVTESDLVRFIKRKKMEYNTKY